MQGPIMELTTKTGLNLRMGPISKDDLSSFVGPHAMHSLQASRYLGRIAAPSIEDEEEWYEKMRTDGSSMSWGLFAGESDGHKLIGGTSLNRIQNNQMFRRATSGILIFDQDYWGKGIATATHAARTYFAFRELGLGVIYSKVFHTNEPSRKAIESVGYVLTGTNRCQGMHRGEWLHANDFELINPDDWAWNAWWSGDQPTEDFLEARERTLRRLEWAEDNIRFT